MKKWIGVLTICFVGVILFFIVLQSSKTEYEIHTIYKEIQPNGSTIAKHMDEEIIQVLRKIGLENHITHRSNGLIFLKLTPKEKAIIDELAVMERYDLSIYEGKYEDTQFNAMQDDSDLFQRMLEELDK